MLIILAVKHRRDVRQFCRYWVAGSPVWNKIDPFNQEPSRHPANRAGLLKTLWHQASTEVVTSKRRIRAISHEISLPACLFLFAAAESKAMWFPQTAALPRWESACIMSTRVLNNKIGMDNMILIYTSFACYTDNLLKVHTQPCFQERALARMFIRIEGS